MKKRRKKKSKQSTTTKTLLSTVGEAARQRQEYERSQAALPPYLRATFRPLQPGEKQINDVDDSAPSSAPGLDRTSKINKMMIDLGRAVAGDRGVDWRGHRRG